MNDEKTGLLCAMAGTSGSIEQSVEALREFPQTQEMENALCEIEQLYMTLKSCDEADNIRLDFAVINDMDYYNGLVFQGYIQGVPRAVLSGGRYDNLMRRFSKPQAALGFAIYLGELTRLLHETKGFDVDAVLIYGKARPEQVLKAMDKLLEEYETVRAEPLPRIDIKAKRVYSLRDDGRMEERIVD
jgi:ATP phosphoribosyltransferase regulatory subunit